MAGRGFHELFAHVIWRTKGGQPIIIPEVETPLSDFLEARCRATPGIVFHGIGATSDHVHLVIEFEPQVALSAVVDDLMGASANEVQLDNGLRAVEWQRGFGIVSFGKKNLPWVLGYVARQKELHGSGKVEARLESCGEAAPPLPSPPLFGGRGSG